tara:strand:+ start:9739 stop:10290 length:552 start_codon:yes stop_codon:yes gene_type:complete
MGYRHIGTAQMYENEADVGRGIANSGVAREDIWLTTKIDNDNHSFEAVHRSADESLTRLGTDYVDLLLIHWPMFHDAPLGETLDAMQELKFAGKVRHLGVSNFSTALVAEAVDNLGHDILCNHIEYHPYLSQMAVEGAVRIVADNRCDAAFFGRPATVEAFAPDRGAGAWLPVHRCRVDHGLC